MSSTATKVIRLYPSLKMGHLLNVRAKAMQALWVRAETTPLVRSLSTDTPQFEYFVDDEARAGSYHLMVDLPHGRERWCVLGQDSRTRTDAALEEARAGHARMAGEAYRAFEYRQLVARRVEFSSRASMHALLVTGRDVDTLDLEERVRRAVPRDWMTLGELGLGLAVLSGHLRLAVFRQYLAGEVELALERVPVCDALPVRRKTHANA